MTPQERKLILGLVHTPRGLGMSDADFLNRFTVNIRAEPQYIFKALETATENKNSEDFECVLILGFRFGFPSECQIILRRAILEDWHTSHENVVSAIEKFKDPENVEALYKTALAHFDYLDYDEAYALGVKCVWALKKIGTENAKEKLTLLTQSSNTVIKQNALARLKELETK